MRPIRGDASDARQHGVGHLRLRSPASCRRATASCSRPRTRLRPRCSSRSSKCEGALHVLFTRRAASLPHHQGQVAFPGGSRDAGDADAEATALREADEEVGLRPADVRVLGRLDDIETVASRFLITPVVGVAPHPYRMASLRARGRHDLHGARARPPRTRHRARRALGLRRPADPDPLLPGRRPGDLGRHASHHAQSARRARPGVELLRTSK